MDIRARLAETYKSCIAVMDRRTPRSERTFLIYVTEINSGLTFGASANRYAPINHKSRFACVLIIKADAVCMKIWYISLYQSRDISPSPLPPPSAKKMLVQIDISIRFNSCFFSPELALTDDARAQAEPNRIYLKESL